MPVASAETEIRGVSAINLPAFEVVFREKGHALRAARPLQAGEPICELVGELRPTPSRFSVQVGAGAHLSPPEVSAQVTVRDFPWVYTNHSCRPNAAICGYRLVAMRPIPAGEEISFDYDSTEAELAEPFACHCGQPGCRGVIRGFRHLDAAERERLRPYLAAHLLGGAGEPEREETPCAALAPSRCLR